MTRRLLVLSLLLAGACKGKGHAEVEGVLIPQASGVVEAEEGETLAIGADADTAEQPLPDAEVVRLALHRDLPWSEVKDLIERLRAAGKRPVLLVGRRHEVKAIQLEDELEETEDTIRVFTYVSGKVCVRPPRSAEALCASQQGKGGHVSRAYTRQWVRRMVEETGARDAVVEVPASLSWADVIRAVDGARTCCGEGEEVRVALEDSPTP